MVREEIIRKYIKGKNVLDVGPVGQTEDYYLWGELKKEAASLTGIDIEASPDDAIIRGNMESYDFGKKFDVIVLGDVLEHVDNQGFLLDNCRRHLREEGILIITTPNARWLTALEATNPTHTLWHDRFTLSTMLARHGFEISGFFYYCGNKKRYNLLLRLIATRRAMLAVCRIKKDKAHEL